MKAEIIDLKKKLIDTRYEEEVIPVFIHNTSDKVLSENQLNLYSPVEVVRKFYKRLITSFPRARGGYDHRNYYVCMDDWKKTIPLIQGIISEETGKLRKEKSVLLNKYNNLEKNRDVTALKLMTLSNKWYVKIGKWIDKRLEKGIFVSFKKKV